MNKEIYSEIKILPQNIHDSWNEFLSEELLNRLVEIQEKIGDNYNPDTENILRFLTNDLKSLKVVILGQDPYPQKGRATGRCFEVGNLKLWSDKFKQVSLKNIVRLIYRSYKGIEEYSDIKTFKEIQKEISDKEFNILQPDKLFVSWEKQGVLLLNTSLTCETGKSDSHRKIWDSFTPELIKYISSKNENLYWFLWGSSASSYKPYIRSGKCYKSRHPMMCFSTYEDDFLKSNCFKDTMAIVDWTGKV